MVALVEKLRPRFLLGENVRGFVNEPLGLERSLFDLESIGYEAVPFIIPACSKNAPHRRDRVWILGYTKYDRNRSDVADTKSYGNRRVSGELVKEGETKKGRGVAHVLQESVNDGQDVADTNDEGFRTRIGGSDHDHETESRNWRADGTRGSSDDERHNSTSTEVEGMDVADSNSKRGCGWDTRWQDAKDVGQSSRSQREDSGRLGEGKSKSSICRMDDGVSRRLDEAGRHAGWENGEPKGMQRVSIGVKDRALRLKTLGNAVVPQVVEQIGKAILEGWSQVNEVA